MNEKKFIETALLSELRIDGRGLYDYRKLTIKFGREYGSSEVQLGHTHVMGFVTAQLVQPYKDRPNDGALSVFTEFSPMADPSFEPGRPGEFAVELGRVIDRGLRESRAVDMESLCVLAGKLVWAIRIDLHILDNGGNLVDAANIAALAALLTFRRPECTLGGEDGQEVTVHPPEVREPIPLIIHHLPIAFTFGFFNNGNILVMDPTYNEEAVMCAKMTLIVNANGDICAIQKAGGEGILQSVIIHCLRLATARAAATTKMIKDAVEGYNREKALQKIRRHPTSLVSSESASSAAAKKNQGQSVDQEEDNEVSRKRVERLKLISEESRATQSNDSESGNSRESRSAKNFIGGPSSWDPYSKGVDTDFLKASLGSRGISNPSRIQKDLGSQEKHSESETQEMHEDVKPAPPVINEPQTGLHTNGGKTLKDAVKPKNKRKKRASSASGAS